MRVNNRWEWLPATIKDMRKTAITFHIGYLMNLIITPRNPAFHYSNIPSFQRMPFGGYQL
jgi:hypothetical protein